MSHEDSGNLLLAVVLMFVAGYVDAAGFLRLGHLFVSFMSGDSTQFATSSVHGDWSDSSVAGGIVLVFVLGVIAGKVISTAAPGHLRRPIILATELLLLSAAMIWPSWEPAVIVPIVVAMGIQNAAMHRAGDVKTSLTYVTGTLVNLGEKLADTFLRPGPATRWAWFPYFLLWTGLIAGAIVGALGYAELQIRALLVPVVVLIILALLTAFIAEESNAQAR